MAAETSQVSGSDDVQKYKDALSCLECLDEMCKNEQVTEASDILPQLSFSLELLDQLRSLETDPVREAAIEEMVKTFSRHKDVLEDRVEKNSQNNNTGIVKNSSSSESGLDRQEQSRKLAIKDTIITKGNLKFGDVAGLSEAKKTLKEAIIIPFMFPHLFTGGRQPWKRILLYGPPGTGKSRLAQAVASEIQSTFYCVSSADLVSSWVGESEKLIKELFQHAMAQEGRSVIFIDEIDSICRKRSSHEEEYTRRIKTELLKQMEGAYTDVNSSKIFLLCATNCPWELDSAFLRRFQKRIYIPLPNKEARLSLMQIHAKTSPTQLSDSDWSRLADQTEGYSGSDIATMVLGALFEPIRHMQEAEYWKYTKDGHVVACEKSDIGAFKASLMDFPSENVIPREVNFEDFMKSLQTNGNTVTVEELSRFEKFTQDFGING